MKKVVFLAALAAAILLVPATAATPVFSVGASAIVTPAKPSFAPKPTNVRQV